MRSAPLVCARRRSALRRPCQTRGRPSRALCPARPVPGAPAGTATPTSVLPSLGHFRSLSGCQGSRAPLCVPDVRTCLCVCLYVTRARLCACLTRARASVRASHAGASVRDARTRMPLHVPDARAPLCVPDVAGPPGSWASGPLAAASWRLGARKSFRASVAHAFLGAATTGAAGGAGGGRDGRGAC